MGTIRLPKRSKASTLIAISSMLLCLSTNIHADSPKDRASKSFSITLQKTKKYCNQHSFKRIDHHLKDLDHPGMYQLQQAEAGDYTAIRTPTNQTKEGAHEAALSQAMIQPAPTDQDIKSQIVLDAYTKIENFSADDPAGQTWVPIKFFKIISNLHGNQPIDLPIDGNPYINFWAYNLSHQTWHNVNIIPYLQQANTQLNSDSPATAAKKSMLPDHNTSLNEHNVATDELLEELLGVHTLSTHPNAGQAKSIWADLSFDCSIGTGAVFYTNRLEQMQLLQRGKNDYFFITKTNEVYKPNWFHDTLNKIKEQSFDPFDRIAHGGPANASFKGIGWSVPITLGIQYVCWQQLLIGVGREMVFNATNRLVHNDAHIKHKEYSTHTKWSTQGRWFVKGGWYAFSNEKHRLFGDIRLCYVHHLGRICAALVPFGPYLHRALAYNLGLGYEQQLTDYLSCTARLSVEQQKFKQFSNTKAYDYNIQYRQRAIYLQVGLSMRCTRYDRSKHLENTEYHNKNYSLNDVSKLEGLQDLLDLD